MADAQSYRNHTRFDPPFHFFAAPVLLLNVLVTVGMLVIYRDHWLLRGWLFVLAVALLVTAGIGRSSALRAQDRVIRLEESLRYQQLLNPGQLVEARELSLRQIIALRFASDGELPGLIRQAVNEQMTPRAIKQAIGCWRPDLDRV